MSNPWLVVAVMLITYFSGLAFGFWVERTTRR
jgi:hypothetical protein